MRNIMVTDFSYDKSEEQENICVFCEKQTLEQLKSRIDNNPKLKYTDIFEVNDDDLQFYLYEAIYESKEKLPKI